MNAEIHVFGTEESVKETHQGVSFAFNSRPQAARPVKQTAFGPIKKTRLLRVFFIVSREHYGSIESQGHRTIPSHSCRSFNRYSSQVYLLNRPWNVRSESDSEL